MPKLEDVHIWVSPVTKKVYIGTLRFEMETDGYLRAKSKVNRTNEFIGTMIKFLQEHGGEVEITEENTGKKFIVKLEEMR